MLRDRFTGLWLHPDFRKLWAGHTIAQVGQQITVLAVPLTAILLLDANAIQMGILAASLNLPALVVGLFVGAWVDRLQRRPLLIAADIGRAILLMSIPAAALLDLLTIEHLYVTAFLVGFLTLVFDVAYRSYLPSLVSRERLIEGNSKLELSRSAAEIGGPGLAGALIQVATAPFAILVHAVSLLFSALFLGAIDASEAAAPARDPERRLWRDIADGLRLVFGHPMLRAIAGCAGTIGFFNAILETVLILYIVQELGLSPGVIGLIFAAGNVGFLLGALIPGRLTGWIGLGPALGLGLLVVGVGDLLVPLAAGPNVVVLIMLAIAQFLFGAGYLVFNINQVSLRQALTPDHLQGRMNATMSFMLYGVVPAGAILGGVLGTTVGLRPTLFLAALGEILAILWLILSPVWSLREHPQTADAG
ncbi:MAG: MFS transporter [Chloroflexia bacterium]|nr:MFS transporter [Chloroflexia bacterium]